MFSESTDKDSPCLNIEIKSIVEFSSDSGIESLGLNCANHQDDNPHSTYKDALNIKNYAQENLIKNEYTFSNVENQPTDLIMNDLNVYQKDIYFETTDKPDIISKSEKLTDKSLISEVAQSACFNEINSIDCDIICDVKNSIKDDGSAKSSIISSLSSSPSSSSLSSLDDSEITDNPRISRKRTLPKLSSSSSSTSSVIDSSTESVPTTIAATSADNISLMFPKWHQLKHISLREIGVFPVCKGKKCVVEKYLPLKQARNSSNFEFGAYACSNLIKRMKLYHSAIVHTGCVNSLNFNQAGNLLASGSDDLNVVIYDWVKRKIHLKFSSKHSSNVFQTKFVPHTGDCHLVTSSRDGQIRLARLSQTGSCKNTIKLAQHNGAVHKLSMQYDSPYTFYSCGEDGVIHEIDLRLEKPVISLTAKLCDKKVSLYSIHTNPIKSFEFCVAGMNQHVLVYDARKIKENGEDCLLRKFCPSNLVTSSKVHITSALYNYDSTEILASYSDDDIYLFNNVTVGSESIDHKLQYTGHCNQATVKGVNFFGPQSEYVISGSDCGHIFIWDRQSTAIVNFFEGNKNGVINVLENHPTIPLLATSGFDCDVKYWLPIDSINTSLKGLDKVLKKNKEERSENFISSTNDIMYLLLQSFRREHPNHRDNWSISDSDDTDDIDNRTNDYDMFNFDDDDDNDEENHDDDDDDDADDITESRPRRPPNAIQCPTHARIILTIKFGL